MKKSLPLSIGSNIFRTPVRFAQGMQTLDEKGYTLYIELGPQPVLLGMGRACLDNGETSERQWIPSLRANREDWEQLLDSVGYLYISNTPIDWKAFYQPYAPNKTTLPTYPFQRQRYWIDANFETESLDLTQLPGATGHPLLGQRNYSATSKDQTIQFQTYLQPNTPAYLNDHQVFGSVVFPGTGYIEMALAAGAEVFNTDQLVLEEVSIEQPLVLTADAPRVVQLLLTPTEDTKHTFEIYSLEAQEPASSTQWVLHATGALALAEDTPPPSVDLIELKARYTQAVDVVELYEGLVSAEIYHGSSFRAVKTLLYKDNESLGHIVLPEWIENESKPHELHPILLDCGLQTLAPIFPDIDDATTYLPVAF